MGKVNGGELYYTIDLKDNTKAKLEEIEKRISKLQTSLVMDVDTKATREKLEQLVAQANELRNNMGANKPIEMNVKGTEQAVQQTAQVAQNQEKVAEATEKATAAAGGLSTEIEKVHEQSSRTVDILKTIGGTIAAVFSADAIKGFLSSLVEVGGQIQKQRLAMSAIFGSQFKSEMLFSRLREQALKSPYGIVELDQYAKQLSAFDIEYNKIYDTTKRLADISSGVGVDIQRIINAYGHVKAQHFLDGMVLRQFTKANIPMLDALADRFERIEGRAVSAGDVIQRVHDKLVTFEDVEGALMDLTDEGGMFHNMQETVSQAVSVRYKNLKDAIDLMYNDIANSTSSVLAAPAIILTDMVKHWETLAGAITGVGSAFVILSTKSAIMTMALGKTTRSTLSAMAAQRQLNAARAESWIIANRKTISDLKEAAATDSLNAKDARRLATLEAQLLEKKKLMVESERLTGEQLKEAMIAGTLTQADLKRLVATRQVNAATRQEIIDLQLLSKAEVEAAMSTNAFALSMKRAWTAISSFFASNAITLGVTAFAVVLGSMIGSFVEHQKKLSEAKDMAIKGAEDLATATRNMQNSLSQPGALSGDDAYKQAIEDMVEYIKDNIPAAEKMLASLFELDDNGHFKKTLEERYTLLKDFIDKVGKLTTDEQRLEDLSEGISETLQKNVHKALQDIDLETYSERIEDDVKDLKDRLIDAFNINKEDAAKVRDALRKAFGDSVLDKDATNAEIARFATQSKEAIEIASQTLGRSFVTNTVSSKIRNLTDDIQTFGRLSMDVFEKIQKKFEDTMGRSFDPNNPVDYSIISTFITQWADKDQDLNEAMRRIIKGELTSTEFQNYMKIISDPDATSEEVLNAKSAIMRTIFLDIKPTWSTKDANIIQQIFSGASPSMGFYEAAEATNKAVEDAKKKLDGIKKSAKDYMKIFGIGKKDYTTKLPTNPGTDSSKYMAFAEDYNKYVDIILEGQKELANSPYSFPDEEDPKKKAKTQKKQTDEYAKQVKDRLSIIKDAYQTFKKYQDVYGSEGAGKKMDELGLFGSVTGKGGKMDIDDYIAKLGELEAEMKKNAGTSEERRKILADIQKLKADAQLEKEKTEMKSLAESTKKQIDLDKKRWKLYRDFLDATGDSNKAYMVAFGLDISKASFRNLAEDLKSQFEEFARSGGFGELNIGDLLDASDDKLANIFGASAEQAKRFIEGYTSALQEAESESEKIYKEGITKVQGFAEKSMQIWSKYQREINEAMARGDFQTANRLGAMRNMEMLENSMQGQQFLGGLGSWTEDQIDRFEQKLIDAAESAYKKSGNLVEYEKNINKIREAAKKLREELNKSYNSKTGANGLKGMTENYQKNLAEGLYDGDEGMQDFVAKFQKAVDRLGTFANKFDRWTRTLNDVWGSVDDMLESFGMGDSNTVKDINALVDTVNAENEALKKIMSGDIIGGAVSAITSPITIWNKRHDERLQKQIDLLQKQNQKLDKMGGMIGTRLDKSLLGKNAGIADILAYAGGFTRERRAAYTQGGAYGVERELLEEKLANTEKMIDKERDKKNKDSDKIDEWTAEAMELRQQIKDYAEEVANNLYGIDLKSWSQNLTDALVTAWENGTDAAKAYGDEVGNIMKEVMKNVVDVSVMQPAMQKIQEMLVGRDGMGGFMADMEITPEEIAQIGGALMGLKEKSALTGELMDRLNDYLLQYGIDMKGTGENTLSNSIEGIREEQADLLASYVNAMRADLSLQKTYVMELSVTQIPELNAIAQSQLVQLSQIQMNTMRNADTADEIRDTLRSVLDGGSRYLRVN